MVGALHALSANVAPVTTMDSPSAMMMNSAQRSAMWPPSTSQSPMGVAPSPGKRKRITGPRYSITTATSHSASRACPSARPPAIQNTPLHTIHRVMRSMFWRGPVADDGSDRKVKNDRPTCMATKASANASPRLSNAFGIEVDNSKPAIISANSITRTGARSGSSQLVTQDVKIHTHHTARNRIAVCTPPSGVKCASSVWEIWVMAKTKTRSKNSST